MQKTPFSSSRDKRMAANVCSKRMTCHAALSCCLALLRSDLARYILPRRLAQRKVFSKSSLISRKTCAHKAHVTQGTQHPAQCSAQRKIISVFALISRISCAARLPSARFSRNPPLEFEIFLRYQGAQRKEISKWPFIPRKSCATGRYATGRSGSVERGFVQFGFVQFRFVQFRSVWCGSVGPGRAQ